MEIQDLDQNPFAQFASWFEKASGCETITYPEAMAVSTIGEDGYPDSRMVLMKEHGSCEDGLGGFIFYSNMNSTKGVSIASNPKVSLNFYWMPLDLQVRIRGDVELVSDEKSDAYFASRARKSQLGAWASEQSRELASREALVKRLEKYELKFAGDEVPRPPHWRGYLVRPVSFIFWQQVENRLHDSFLYEKEGDSWRISRRNP